MLLKLSRRDLEDESLTALNAVIAWLEERIQAIVDGRVRFKRLVADSVRVLSAPGTPDGAVRLSDLRSEVLIFPAETRTVTVSGGGGGGGVPEGEVRFLYQ